MQFAKGLRTSFDFQAPQALTALPANNAVGVQLTASISVFFSEPISIPSLSGAFVVSEQPSGAPVPGHFEASQNGVIVTFHPDQPLQAFKDYRVSVSTDVQDLEDNHLQAAFTGTFQTQALGTGILVSSNNLSAPINELLPPIGYRALNVGGTPAKQVPVTFTARMGAGVFEPSGRRQIVVLSDDQGFAQATLRLGAQASEHTVEISAVGFSSVPLYRARATSQLAANLRVYSGNRQSGSPGQSAPFPLVMEATDSGGNPVAGTTVTIRVVEGSGFVNGSAMTEVPTNSSGIVSVEFAFGPSSGAVLVQGSFSGMTGQSPSFDLMTLLPRPSSPTVITGRVVDAQSLQPLHRVYVYLADTPSTWDWTDEDGQFRLATSPGPHVVDVDGFESGQIGGHLYPVVAIPVNAVEGQENDLGMPALLPRLEIDSYIDVSETQGGTLTLRSNPAWKMYVAPGQARFGNGGRTGRLYVASVPPDRIPMPPAGGKISRFFDTIQPLSVSFMPPAQVSFPNVDNLPGGTVTDIYTLSYSSGTFLKTGRGQVSDDGAVINSLPGEGITLGGWHQAPPPTPPGDTCISGRIVDTSGRGIRGCSVTVGGRSATTGGFGSYRLCNIPANAPLVPIVLCPVNDQCSVDTDGDGYCDEFERRNGPGGGGSGGGGGGGGGGNGGGGGGDDDEEEHPDVDLEVYPKTVYLNPGESVQYFVTVLVDGQPKAGERVEIEDTPDGAMLGAQSVATADTRVVELLRNPAVRTGVVVLAFRVPGVVVAGVALSVVGRVIEKELTSNSFLLDTNIVMSQVHTCDEPIATKALIGAFLLANRGNHNLFAPNSILSEMPTRRVPQTGGGCRDEELSLSARQDILTNMGVTVIADVDNPAIDDQVLIAADEFNTAGRAGRFGPGRFEQVFFSPVDRKMMTTAGSLKYKLVTNDAGILRVDNKKTLPLDVISLNPCIRPLYPRVLTGSFCGPGDRLP